MARKDRQKLPKGSHSGRGQAGEDDQITDPRFKNIQTSAVYRLPSKKETRVTVDQRFGHMLKDEKFTRHAKVDRYGRRLNSKKGERELERLYRVEKEASPTDEEEGESEVESDAEVQAELRRVERDQDPARNGGFAESSSDESSSDEDDEIVEDNEVQFLDQQAADAPAGEVSSRLAAVNMDWDNLRAADIMAALSSFSPSGGRILKTAIYPSEFGKERMEREDIEGPPKEVFATSVQGHQAGAVDDEAFAGEEDDSEAEEARIKESMLTEDDGEEFNSTQLRQYQIERLRYYYAVVTCSSKKCAKEIYDSVDGAEYLSSANFFDLRFIPDEMDFDEDTPRDECQQLPDGYEPSDFVTGALQHSKVTLSWDAEDPRRKEVQKHAFSGSRNAVSENDLKAYLASDSSDYDDVGQDGNEGKDDKEAKRESERKRMRSLLGLSDAPSHVDKESHTDHVGDMQITFSSGLSDRKQDIFEDGTGKEETTIEKYARREREKKAERKERYHALVSQADDGDAANATEENKEELGFDDPFFTAPEKDRTRSATQLKEAKRKKRREREAEEARADEQRAELELLVTEDHDTAGQMAHFDMKHLEKGEKVLRKKSKHRAKLSLREQQAAEAKTKDTFAMDVTDPRFQAVFERSGFAVDPSNPKFKPVEGNQALLKEYRRKRAAGEVDPGKLGRKKAKI